jgi:hypothetical protein
VSDRGFVVTRPYPDSGIGSNLVSFAGSLWLASELGRDVIVDWRNSSFLHDKSTNLFTEFLEPVEEIQGVRVTYASGAEAPWDTESEEAQLLDPVDVTAILASGSDARYIVLTAFHSYERIEPGGDPLERLRRLRTFFESIRPRAHLQREVEEFAVANHLDDGFVVAVNIGTGNGEFRKGSPFHGRVKTELFHNERRFIRTLMRARRAALGRLPDHLRENAITFVATDAAFMREMLLRLPNSVTRRSVFPPPGAGRGFADYDVPGYTDRDAFADIVVDHFLLARCNAMIRNPSMFSTYALVTTNFFNGNLRNVETMYPSYHARAAARRARGLLPV